MGYGSVMIHLLCQHECTSRKNRPMGIRGGGEALIPEPSSSALGFLLKKQKRQGRHHFRTSKKKEHTGVLELQAARQQPVSGEGGP